jgi:hypothetical protein
MKRQHIEPVMDLAKRAITSGGDQTLLHKVRWAIGANCTAPVLVAVTGTTDKEDYNWVVGPGQGRSLLVDLHVRCRKCEACMHHRRATWFYRAVAETTNANRTWFGTLTLRPEEHFKALCLARSKHPGFDGYSALEQLRTLNKGVYQEVQKYFKRIRKDSGSKLRYLLVCEAHKSGLPHYHLLLHEVTEGDKITKATLRDQWTLGFSKWKLVENNVRASGYVAKYLFKAETPRPFASKHYGETASKAVEPVVKSTTEEV